MGGMGPQRPPNVQVNPDGMPMGSQQEWRHMMMSQQQSMTFNVQSGGGGVHMRQGGFNGGESENLTLFLASFYLKRKSFKVSTMFYVFEEKKNKLKL